MMTRAQPATAAAGREKREHSAEKGTIEYLLDSMRRGSDFPALSESIRSLNRLAESTEQDMRGLASVIIGDFALTNKILKVVNSAYYSSFSGKIGSISRAIVVLGIEAVRALAASLIFLEHLNDKGQAAQLRSQISTAIFSATLARQLALNSGTENSEGSFLCGMLQNLGGILVTYYLPAERGQIDRLTREPGRTPEMAQQKVLGMTYETLGVAVAEHWNFPNVITLGMRQYDSETCGESMKEDARLRLVASLANQAAVEIISGKRADVAVLGEPVAKYCRLLGLKPDQFSEIVRDASQEFNELHGAFIDNKVHAPLSSEGARERVSGVSGSGQPVTPVVPAGVDEGKDSFHNLEMDAEQEIQGDAADAEKIMTEGLQEVSRILMADNGTVNQVFNVVLETLYRAMAFRHVVLCLQDGRRGQYQARLGFGRDINDFMTKFRFPSKYRNDVFHAALKNNVDLYVEDTEAKNIKSDLPVWYTQTGSAGSFILLPINWNQKPVGLIYADHKHAKGMVLSGNQLNLMKALRNQMLLAFRTLS